MHIVSDDDAVRRALTILLRLEGHCVTSTDSITALLAAHQAGQCVPRECCLLIDDRWHTGGDTMRLAEALALARDPPPMVILADLPDERFRRRARQARVAAVLEKPAAAVAVVLTIARALSEDVAGCQTWQQAGARPGG